MTTGYNAQDMAIQINDIQESITALQHGENGLNQALQETASLLQSAVHLLNKAYGLKDVYLTATISSTPLTLDRQGRNYLLIFTPSAITAISVNAMGITGYSLNLNAGWNMINFPDGTILTGASGTNQPVIIKATNFYQGSKI